MRKKIKIILWEKGITQRELSKQTGIPESYISYFLRGKFILNEIQKAKIAGALGVPVDEVT